MRIDRTQFHTDQLLHGLDGHGAKWQQHFGKRHEHHQHGNVIAAECDQCDALHNTNADRRTIGSSTEYGNQ